MTRCLGFIVVSTVALGGLATLPGCNNPSCGDRTHQVQQKDGTLKCEAVDSPASLTPCQFQAGATTVGGFCVGAVSCGPGTILVNGQCVGNGTGGGCPAPSPDKICVSGDIKNLENGTPLTDSITVSIYDPVQLLSG